MKVLKACAVALMVVGVLGSAATVAHATALSAAYVLIDNLLFLNADTDTVLDASDFETVFFTNSAQVTASLNPGGSQTFSGDGSPLDLYACVGVGCPVNNSFPALTPPPTSTFATGDQFESGAPISGLGIAPVGATVDAAAYASILNETVLAAAAAENGLTAVFTFILGNDTTVDITFDAEAYLRAWIAPGEAPPTNANASITTCFDVTRADTGAQVIRWCPNGVAAQEDPTDIGIVASVEPFSLNETRARTAPTAFNDVQFGPFGPSSFSATTIPLLGGVEYQLSARQTAVANAREVAQQVPGPATLILLGGGLLGLGAALGLRRKS